MSEATMTAMDASKGAMNDEAVKARLFLEYKQEGIEAGMTEAEAEQYATLQCED